MMFLLLRSMIHMIYTPNGIVIKIVISGMSCAQELKLPATIYAEGAIQRRLAGAVHGINNRSIMW